MIAGLLVVLITCVPAARGQQAVQLLVPGDEAYVHAPSGLIFPAALGTFGRVGVHRYGADESNISVEYNDNASAIVLTAYVYPARGRMAAEEFEQVKGGIITIHPDARLVSEGAWTLRQNGHDFPGLRARYAFAGDWAGRRRQDLLSDAYLLLLGGAGDAACFVKFRVTYPAAREMAANQAIGDFLARLPFPVPAAATRPAK
jgi:hypothetical protein